MRLLTAIIATTAILAESKQLPAPSHCQLLDQTERTQLWAAVMLVSIKESPTSKQRDPAGAKALRAQLAADYGPACAEQVLAPPTAPSLSTSASSASSTVSK